MATNPFRYFKTSPEIIHLGVFLYVRFPLSLRNVGDLLHERGKAAALKFLKKAMKRHGKTHVVVTDKCPSYRAAMKGIGNEGRQKTGRHLNNRAENSHLPFRRRGRAMSRFRRMRGLQKFVSVHSSVHNHFNFERHTNTRARFKQKRDSALREWRDLLVA